MDIKNIFATIFSVIAFVLWVWGLYLIYYNMETSAFYKVVAIYVATIVCHVISAALLYSGTF